MTKTIKINKVKMGGNNPFVLIAGPCVIEDRRTTKNIARSLKRITDKLNIPLIFKASYDKANRTSIKSFRGPGLIAGLEILDEIKKEFNVPVISDVHSVEEIYMAAKTLDVIQIPAFLCRQTDMLVAAGMSGAIVNVKKGQFLAPALMKHALEKIKSTGNSKIMLTERGTTFGYSELVADFKSIAIMRDYGYPVVFDATHSVQQPGGLGHASSGSPEHIPLLSRCAVAAGCDGLFMEVHSNPDKALSDGPNMLPLNKLEKLLKNLKKIDQIVKSK